MIPEIERSYKTNTNHKASTEALFSFFPFFFALELLNDLPQLTAYKRRAGQGHCPNEQSVKLLHDYGPETLNSWNPLQDSGLAKQQRLVQPPIRRQTI